MKRALVLALAVAAVACAGEPTPPPKEPPPLVIPPVASAAVPTAKAVPPAKPTPEYERLVANLEGADEPHLEATLNELRQLADPRSADAIAKLLEGNPPAKVRSLATQALYELRDMRAVPRLVELLASADTMDGIVAARGLADLALMYPELRAGLRAEAEEAVLAWLAKRPMPHANAMKFLGLVRSPRGIAKLRAWADPPDPLPKKGAQPPFPEAFAIAQSALRWLGASHDEKAYAILVKQLNRRPANADMTMEALLQGGTALQGMSVRALTYGAADGLAEAGDAKAVPVLLAFAQEPKNNEQSRFEACLAIGALATEAQIREIAAKVKDPGTDDKKAVVTVCLLSAVERRSDTEAAAKLLPLLAKNVTPSIRLAAARAMGSAPLDKATTVSALRPMLDDPELRVAAATALVFGGGDAEAKAACAKLDATGQVELAGQVVAQFGTLVERWVRDHHLSRMVSGIRACGVAAVTQAMTATMSGIAYENGPGTLSRVVGRWLVNDDRLAEDRREVLEALGERGLLDATR